MSGIRITLEVKRANVCHSENAKILTFEDVSKGIKKFLEMTKWLSHIIKQLKNDSCTFSFF